ncbi:lipoprotein LenA [Leptospira andrefontaineae]|uniref:Lipoprotein LenA n=1 Tax=Leptospira andrefontaineae TaxID=2484976 RepID=A0A4R9H150_9LEPT|nr:lipoprotein LenA [Leptospira andrefontaineae]TGK38034.1 lipoprotein LenA [Leptospira andrefontaineae]
MRAIALIFTILALLACDKKKEETPIAQIVGTKYSGGDQYVYKKPGTKEKSEQVTLVYENEEVNGLEIVPFEFTDAKGNKTVTDYLKLKTVDGKEGFALLKNFYDAVLFVVGDGDTAFAKNSLTSPSKGKLEKGMSCFESEASGEFSKVRCSGSILKGGKLNNLHDIWIQPVSSNISRDPLLGDSVRNLKAASLKLIELNKTTDLAKQEELKKGATAALKTVFEKGDIFQESVNSLATEFGLTLSEQQPTE